MRSLSRGPSPLLTLKVPGELFTRIERARKLAGGQTRSAFLRDLISIGLSVVPGGQNEGGK